MVKDNFHLIGYAFGEAGADINTGNAPLVLQQSHDLSSWGWDAMIHAVDTPGLRMDEKVAFTNELLAKKISTLIQHQQAFCVLGGDHTSAIGTWSGAYDALHRQGDIGLIWVDAHMDSHTPETSLSGRVHGMPLASLLGYGYPTLTSILQAAPKLKPSNVCLIGVRSYEAGEAALLKRLNVKVYEMDEIKHRGFMTVWREAVQIVNQHTIGYGISLDLDGIDPSEAPGVDVPELNGLKASDVGEALTASASDPRLIGTEIVEFDPSRDEDKKTEKLIVSFLAMLAEGVRSKA